MHLTEDGIYRIAESVFCMILGLELHRGGEPPSARGSERTLSASVSISGAWDGIATLTCSASLADRAAATMFGIQPGTPQPDQVHDAIGELANMVGGNVKALLPEPSRLSLPAVAPGVGYGQPGGELLRVPMTCGGEPVLVVVARTPARAAPARENA